MADRNMHHRVMQNREFCKTQMEILMSDDANGTLFNPLMATQSTASLNDKHDKCIVDFDGSTCWKETAAGETDVELCPFVFCDECQLSDFARSAYRTCNANGTWASPNYENCRTVFINFKNCFVSGCNACADPWNDLTRYISVGVSLASLILLLVSIVIFCSFKSIQCRRLSIHKHLAAAFVGRVGSYLIWTLIHGIHMFDDCDAGGGKIQSLEFICKFVLFLVVYFQCASIFWMSVEGGYLITRFTVFAMRNTEGPWWIYMAMGWGVPVVPVASWVVLHTWDLPHDSYCWMPYASSKYMVILTTFLGFALVLNMFFLGSIMMILIRKLWAENAAESKKVWKTMKATLLLVPLLGISNVPLFYEPIELKDSALFQLVSAVLQYSQGIFIAILYCFANGEIQSCMSRYVRGLHWYQTCCPPSHEPMTLRTVRHSVSEAVFTRRRTRVNHDDAIDRQPGEHTFVTSTINESMFNVKSGGDMQETETSMSNRLPRSTPPSSSKSRLSRFISSVGSKFTSNNQQTVVTATVPLGEQNADNIDGDTPHSGRITTASYEANGTNVRLNLPSDANTDANEYTPLTKAVHPRPSLTDSGVSTKGEIEKMETTNELLSPDDVRERRISEKEENKISSIAKKMPSSLE